MLRPFSSATSIRGLKKVGMWLGITQEQCVPNVFIMCSVCLSNASCVGATQGVSARGARTWARMSPLGRSYVNNNVVCK